MHTACSTNISIVGGSKGNYDYTSASNIRSLCTYLVSHSGKEHELEISEASTRMICICVQQAGKCYFFF